MPPVALRRFPLALVALAVGSLLLPIHAADAPKKPAKEEPANPYQAAVPKGAAKPGGEGKVYRNEDLYKLFGGAPTDAEEGEAVPEGGETPRTEATPSPAVPVGDAAPSGAEAAPAPENDPLKQLLDQQAKAAEHQKLILDAEGQVKAAQEKIADLEKRVLAIRNPLLPRPAAPEEKAEEWNRADGAARVDLSQEQLRMAREQLAASEAKLDELRRTAP